MSALTLLPNALTDVEPRIAATDSETPLNASEITAVESAIAVIQPQLAEEHRRLCTRAGVRFNESPCHLDDYPTVIAPDGKWNLARRGNLHLSATSPLLRRLARLVAAGGHGQIRGILVTHMDMIVVPHLFAPILNVDRRMRLENPGHLSKGAGKEVGCYSPADAHALKLVGKGAKHKILRQQFARIDALTNDTTTNGTDDLAAVLGQNHSSHPSVCGYGWIDLLYLPNADFEAVQLLSRLLWDMPAGYEVRADSAC